MKKKIIIGLGVLYIFLCINPLRIEVDFDVFLNAAVKLSQHQNIYAPPYLNGLKYYYSPLFAMLLVPLSKSFFIAKCLWLLLGGYLLYRISVLLNKYFDYSFLEFKEICVLYGVALFLIYRFLSANIALVQMTIFLLWAIMESVDLIKNQKYIIGALLLAFVINVKLMPLIILPYLVYRTYFKACLFVILFSVFFLFIPTLFIGYQYNDFLMHQWWGVINPGNTEHLIEPEINSQSFVGMIPVFLTETTSEFSYKRNFLNLPISTVLWITNLVRLFFIVLTPYFLGIPFKKSKDNLLEIRALAYLLLLVPLIFPHQQKYAFFFIFPMVFYLCYYCVLRWKYDRTTGFKVYLISLILISLFFTPLIGSSIIGRTLYDLVHYFRILGICVLLLIPFSMFANPKKIHELIPEKK